MFLNAQQRYIQWTIHITLFIPFNQSLKPFQTLNTSKKHDKIFVLLLHQNLQNLLPNSTNIQCKSLIDKYKLMNFHNITYLAKFIVDYDVETYNKQNNDKIIFWISFNLHKDQ
jgi:hypothetical protein